MRIKRVQFKQFKRFADLTIENIPPSARLVVMVGPNGNGKSSVFDGLLTWFAHNSGRGSWDSTYHQRDQSLNLGFNTHVNVELYPGAPPLTNAAEWRAAFYFRSAYRNDPDFQIGSLNRMGPVIEELRFRRMIDQDASVQINYQRLASSSLEHSLELGPSDQTLKDFRELMIGPARDSMARLFPNLVLNSLGNPLENATFRFDKDGTRSFNYKNLSGGEKAAFDLVLDIMIKRAFFQTVTVSP
jgi:hypothetical protein